MVILFREKERNIILPCSSVASEYRGIAKTTCEIIWTRNLLGETYFSQTKPINILTNDKTATHDAHSHITYKQTKHSRLSFHSRNSTRRGTITVPESTSQQLH